MVQFFNHQNNLELPIPALPPCARIPGVYLHAHLHSTRDGTLDLLYVRQAVC